MSEELDDIVENLKETSAWIRIILMFAYAVILYLVIAPVIFVIMLAQALFSVITGDPNKNLTYFGAALTRFVSQILGYLTYNSDTRPFPFTDFPDEEKNEAASTAVKKTASKKKTSRKSAAKKKTSRPKTAEQ